MILTTMISNSMLGKVVKTNKNCFRKIVHFLFFLSLNCFIVISLIEVACLQNCYWKYVRRFLYFTLFPGKLFGKLNVLLESSLQLSCKSSELKCRNSFNELWYFLTNWSKFLSSPLISAYLCTCSLLVLGCWLSLAFISSWNLER